MPDRIVREEYYDETGAYLFVEHDIPGHPKYTIEVPAHLSLEEMNVVWRRLCNRAGLSEVPDFFAGSGS